MLSNKRTGAHDNVSNFKVRADGARADVARLSAQLAVFPVSQARLAAWQPRPICSPKQRLTALPSSRSRQVGDVVEGTVMSVKPYGAFVEIGGGVSGAWACAGLGLWT